MTLIVDIIIMARTDLSRKYISIYSNEYPLSYNKIRFSFLEPIISFHIHPVSDVLNDADYDPCAENPEYHLDDIKDRCSHTDFFDNLDIKKLREDPKLINMNLKYCCEDHGFVYEHACEVSNIVVLQANIS